MTDLNSKLVEDWLLQEMAAHSIVSHRDGEYVFLGDRHDFIIEVKAFPVRKVATRRLTEPIYDFGPDYDDTRGYD